MSKAIENLTEAAQAIRPRVGGFPYLAEVLRKAGVTRNIWSLPSGQSLFLTRLGNVVVQGDPLVNLCHICPEKKRMKTLQIPSRL